MVHTPFGHPSDAIIAGELDGREVYFLPRHGRGHTLMAHEVNHRANIWALKSLGVSFIICVNAVGSLKQEYAPRDIVLIDQFYDRTSNRAKHTFFGKGIAAHIPFAEPISAPLREILRQTAESLDCVVHDGGTYVNMDGPAFSTRAESNVNRQLGFDVIGMTNAPEAKLAREAEIALATLAMVTDYDCWKVDDEPVSLQAIIEHMTANSQLAQRVVREAVKRIPTEAHWDEHNALGAAIVTAPELWPEDTISNLEPILRKYLPNKGQQD